MQLEALEFAAPTLKPLSRCFFGLRGPQLTDSRLCKKGTKAIQADFLRLDPSLTGKVNWSMRRFELADRMAIIAPIVIERLSEENFHDVDKCDGTFLIDSELAVYTKSGLIEYDIVSVEPYKKRYVADKNRDLRGYIDNPKGAVYLAYIEDKVCGQMILTLNWNNFALIEDLEVDLDFRRQGVGQGLLEQAKVWAKEMKLAGVTLETQNNNVAACLFYKRSGFELCGFDRNLYKGMDPNTNEIALYWYHVFNEDDLSGAVQ